jgi:hypothetical protein
MASESLKSIPIVNADAFPIILNSLGSGSPGYLRSINAHLLTTSGVTSPSLYRLVRLPTTAKVKHVYLSNGAMGGSAAADVDVGFSDSLTDGTSISFINLSSPIVQTTGPADNKLFGAATSLVAAAKNTDITFANNFTTDHQNMMLWQVLVDLGTTQFTADPLGFFDIIIKTTTTVTAGADISIEIQYVSSS